MGFVFPLATVLRMRESIEQREERALQHIHLEIARVERRIDDLNRHISDAHEARAQALRRVIAASHLHAMLQDTQTAEEHVLALRTSLAALREQRETQRAVYQAAHRDHETLLNLYDAQRKSYQQEQLRAEQRSLDDIFLARTQRIKATSPG
jgi:flagellar export protein FliJ